jgi:hypothetical protein
MRNRIIHYSLSLLFSFNMRKNLKNNSQKENLTNVLKTLNTVRQQYLSSPLTKKNKCKQRKNLQKTSGVVSFAEK